MRLRSRTPKPTAFYIEVAPVGSLFAKRLQAALKDKVVEPVYRVLPGCYRLYNRQGRSQSFKVTQNPLNKIQQFNKFKDASISCPNYATNDATAREINCKTLFARTLINSTNGRGIVEFAHSDEVYPRAPLYTEYIPKKAEYRFHVLGGKVIDIQQKKKRKGFNGERDTRVRNMVNGYVYCRDGVSPPSGAGDLAVAAVAALGYSYGAVDVIYNEKNDKSYVLEVNSRPGLMGATLDSYANAIISTYGLTTK